MVMEEGCGLWLWLRLRLGLRLRQLGSVAEAVGRTRAHSPMRMPCRNLLTKGLNTGETDLAKAPDRRAGRSGGKMVMEEGWGLWLRLKMRLWAMRMGVVVVMVVVDAAFVAAGAFVVKSVMSAFFFCSPWSVLAKLSRLM